MPRSRPIRAGDAGTSGDADLDDGARSRALSASLKAPNCEDGPARMRLRAAARAGPILGTSRSSASVAEATPETEPNRSTSRRAVPGLMPGTVARSPAGETTARRRPRNRTDRPSAAALQRAAMSRSQRAESCGPSVRTSRMPPSSTESSAPRTPLGVTPRPASRSAPSTIRYATSRSCRSAAI